MRVINLIYFLPNGNTVSEIMDERLDMSGKSAEMTNDLGYNYSVCGSLLEGAE
ncbi:hypothetical protein Harman_40400 [Haloarcula mannanilytica]|uniref:Uncharacterized protein n=1 Tax=Haloarcula mannanilytica TaxID=2509225 RepID=A0A4C2EP61_9EURY|nr:hypothetical protein Harman_40400 [Haloarcula mannanilytica]